VDAYPKRLGEFLAEDFLECSVGRLDLWYDWERKALTFELPLGARLTTKFLAAIQVVGSRAFKQRLLREWASGHSTRTPLLPDDAISRESIYGESAVSVLLAK
jgi:hypothetical protein